MIVFTRNRGLALLGLLVAGCGEPPSIVPVAPPGLEVQQEIPIPEDQKATALGETRSTSPGATTEAEASAAEAPALDPANAPAGLPPTEPGETKTTNTGLKYTTLKPGSGAEAKAGQNVTVHYVGTFPDGKKPPFDSSRDRGEPYTIKLGVSQVIRGWHEGIAGMKVGETRKLTIPPELAYGPQGRPPVIPPNATLVFEIELLGVK